MDGLWSYSLGGHGCRLLQQNWSGSSNLDTGWAQANWAISNSLLDSALLIAVCISGSLRFVWDHYEILIQVSLKSLHITVGDILNCYWYRIEKSRAVNGKAGVILLYMA